MICPPDVLCKWISEENRWETLEELAMALECEAGLWRQYELSKESGRRVERMMSLVTPKRSRFVA